MYGLQHGVLAHTEQQAIKGPKITSVKLFKRENQRSNLYKIKKKKRCIESFLLIWLKLLSRQYSLKILVPCR